MDVTWKHRLYEILEAGRAGDVASRIFDGAMVALILASVASVVAGSVPSIAAEWGAALDVFDAVTIAIFTVEYVLRLWTCTEHPPVRPYGPVQGRLRFAASPLMVLDLIVILPGILSAIGLGLDLRILRMLRLLRFLRLARFSPALATLGRVFYAERRALWGAIIVMGGAILFAATIMYELESDAQPERFASIPDAMWWAVAALTTVGFGDVVPVTPWGKFFGGLIMILGLGMFALPAGILATGFVNEIHRRDFVVTWGMIARVPLFSGLDAPALGEIMSILRSRSFPPGHVIAYRGDAADGMFFIVAGEVEAELPSGSVQLGPGDFFGEIALLKRARREATSVAVSRAHVLELEAEDFEALLRRNPELKRRVIEAAETRMANDWADAAGDLAPGELRAD